MQTETKILQRFTRLVLPFTFKSERIEKILRQTDSFRFNRSTARERAEGSALWKAPGQVASRQFFFPHIFEFLESTADDSYLFRREMTPEALSLLFGLYGKDKRLQAALGKYCSEFEFTGFDLYLLKSGIGFLIAECSLVNPSPDAIIDFSYHIRYFSKYSAEISFCTSGFHEKKVKHYSDMSAEYKGNTEASGMPEPFVRLHSYEVTEEGTLKCDQKVGLYDLFSELLALVFTDKDRLMLDVTGDNLLVFNYVFSSPFREDAEREEFLYRAGHVFKESYVPHPGDLGNNCDHTLDTFRNIHFGITLEGAVILVEDTGHAFFGQFAERVKNGYFMLYMLALHNRLASIHFRIRITQIMPSELGRIHRNRRFVKTVRHFRNEILSFYLNAYFVQVTNNTNYERVYRMYNQAFDVEVLLNEVKKKTDEIDDVLNRENERQSNSLMKKLTVLGAVFVPFSLILGLFGANFTSDVHPAGQFMFEWMHLIYSSAGLAVILFFVLLFYRIWR